MAAETIKIEYSAYKKSIKVIDDARKRPKNNNSNFQGKISKTNLPCITSYMDTLETLRTHLDSYNTLMEKDTGKLLKIGKQIHQAGGGK